jgi:hypothetical protein
MEEIPNLLDEITRELEKKAAVEELLIGIASDSPFVDRVLEIRASKVPVTLNGITLEPDQIAAMDDCTIELWVRNHDSRENDYIEPRELTNLDLHQAKYHPVQQIQLTTTPRANPDTPEILCLTPLQVEQLRILREMNEITEPHHQQLLVELEAIEAGERAEPMPLVADTQVLYRVTCVHPLECVRSGCVVFHNVPAPASLRSDSIEFGQFFELFTKWIRECMVEAPFTEKSELVQTSKDIGLVPKQIHVLRVEPEPEPQSKPRTNNKRIWFSTARLRAAQHLRDAVKHTGLDFSCISVRLPTEHHPLLRWELEEFISNIAMWLEPSDYSFRQRMQDNTNGECEILDVNRFCLVHIPEKQQQEALAMCYTRSQYLLALDRIHAQTEVPDSPWIRVYRCRSCQQLCWHWRLGEPTAMKYCAGSLCAVVGPLSRIYDLREQVLDDCWNVARAVEFRDPNRDRDRKRTGLVVSDVPNLMLHLPASRQGVWRCHPNQAWFTDSKERQEWIDEYDRQIVKYPRRVQMFGMFEVIKEDQRTLQEAQRFTPMCCTLLDSDDGKRNRTWLKGKKTLARFNQLKKGGYETPRCLQEQLALVRSHNLARRIAECFDHTEHPVTRHRHRDPHKTLDNGLLVHAPDISSSVRADYDQNLYDFGFAVVKGLQRLPNPTVFETLRHYDMIDLDIELVDSKFSKEHYPAPCEFKPHDKPSGKHPAPLVSSRFAIRARRDHSHTYRRQHLTELYRLALS